MLMDASWLKLVSETFVGGSVVNMGAVSTAEECTRGDRLCKLLAERLKHHKPVHRMPSHHHF